MKFDKKFYRKFDFKKADIAAIFSNAMDDLNIAKKSKFTKVRFSYSYQALIKLGIVLLAKVGGVKMRSIPGHHVKVLEEMSRILRDEGILEIGNAMRMKRNANLYGSGITVGEKEAEDYYKFVNNTAKKIKKIVKI